MRKIVSSFIFGLILLPISNSWAASTCSDCSTSSATCQAGVTPATVNTCLGSTPDGGTINFASGSYTWDSGITLPADRAVSLIGAGAGSSNVNMTGGNIWQDSVTATGVYRISGFTFDGVSSGSVFIQIASPAGYVSQMRIDHNTFSNNNTASGGKIIIIAGSVWSGHLLGNTYGVVDHNTVSGTYNPMFVEVFGRGETVAETVSKKGTANNLFIEDNTYSVTNWSDTPTSFVDCWAAGSVVIRHNSITNNLMAAHEPGHSGGCLNFEAYNNTLIRVDDSYHYWLDGHRLIHHQGSGEIFIFNNSFTAPSGKSESAIGLTDYRGCPQAVTSSGLPECDNTQSIDGNWSPSGTYHGYPCWRQAGRMLGGAVTTNGQPGTLSPVYVWNNYWSDNNAQVPIAIEVPWGGEDCPSEYITSHLVANRDYYNAISASAQSNTTTPFNGTTGMGFGTLANRPTSCTTNSLESGGGVGYFATDQGPQGTLYRCSATDTWTTHYTPYDYPHLLQGGSPSTPTPVTGLRISGGSIK